MYKTYLVVLSTLIVLTACGEPPNECEECTAGVEQGLDTDCSPYCGDEEPPPGDDPPPAQATLSVSIRNAASVPRTFTLGASVLNATRTTIYANAVPLSGVELQPGETRSFPGLLSTSDPTLIFVTGAVGYDVAAPESHARSEPVVNATIGSHACSFVYEDDVAGARMSSECY